METESQSRTIREASMPVATTALNSRAPSMCTEHPEECASSQMASIDSCG